MLNALAGILLALCRGSLWVPAMSLKSLLAWLLWILWPFVILAGAFVFALSSASSCEAGWIDWLWGDSSDQNAEQFRRAAELAGESTRIAGEVAAAQARQASEQARQNTQVAEMLQELSSERQDFARRFEDLAASALRDSEWAAALSATGPLIICVCVLVIAGLALWMAMRTGAGIGSGAGANYDASLAMDVLVEELVRAQGDSHVGSQAGTHVTHLAATRDGHGSCVALPGPLARIGKSGPVEPYEPDDIHGLDDDGCPF